MADMLVKLYDLPESVEHFLEDGIVIKRALALDKSLVLDYVKQISSIRAFNECEYAFTNHPVSCYIAVKDKQVIGYACYDVTAKNFFGPTVVSPEFRGFGIGKALLLKSLISMREAGYGYAIIGGAAATAIPFYEKVVGATLIENSKPGVYGAMIQI